MATVRAVTLGCKVNQYETEYVRQGLHQAGFRDAAEHEQADLCLVNTCTVTHEGDAKSRQLIRRLARENPRGRIVVMGCYATRAPQEVAALPGVAEVITDKRELPDWLGRAGVADVPRGISHFTGRHRAWVKVQDGCLLRCSYCVIPLVRPNVVSRPMTEIADEVRRLVDNGYREIVLTGIHLGHYGVEGNRGVEGNQRLPKSQWTRLSHLLACLARLPGNFRVRLSSIEATEVTRELLDVMAEHPERICPHLHICLQSGSDKVLRRMRRPGGLARFLDRCALAKCRLPEPALTTDVIVGFPGETDDDFEQTCRVCREVGFSQLHVFSYSRRAGTPAAALGDQVPRTVVSARANHLKELARAGQLLFLRQHVGKRLQVLVESPVLADGSMVGIACRYVAMRFTGSPALESQLTWIIARSVDVKDCQLIG